MADQIASSILARIIHEPSAYDPRGSAGMTRADDSLPPRMTSEPLTAGAGKGHVVDLEPMLNEYNLIRGWDDQGWTSAV